MTIEQKRKEIETAKQMILQALKNCGFSQIPYDIAAVAWDEIKTDMTNSAKFCIDNMPVGEMAERNRSFLQRNKAPET